MRRAVWLGFAVAVLLAVGTVPALAQTILRVDIPFAFQVEGKQMPAGAYEIVQGPESVLTIRSADGKTQAVLVTVTRLARPRALWQNIRGPRSRGAAARPKTVENPKPSRKGIS